jgi:UDP-N-acetylglucosamine--N-acetylmuramyl-(pentapeptide) pyrophosphoryl-undecaprenol N-acetylglucosamine transferase
MKIVLATGGTGGHIFPAQALAEELLKAGAEVEFMVDERFFAYYEKTKANFPNVPIHKIMASPISGGGAQKLKGACKNALAVAQAWAILRTSRPDVVVGFGGYPSLPTMIAARGCKRIIHEQNAVMGKANRMLAGRACAIITAFEKVGGIAPEHQSKVLQFGNPVRHEILALSESSYHAPYQGEINLLVMGGSQAASIFAEIIPQAIKLMPNYLKARLRITQQAKSEQILEMQTQYANMGVTSEIAPFFANITAKLAGAHLVIARAGASTIAELSCAALPAIFVPLPSSADNHQLYNATAICNEGGGWLMEQANFNAVSLAKHLQKLFENPTLLDKASNIARCLSTPDAAQKLAQYILHTGNN